MDIQCRMTAHTSFFFSVLFRIEQKSTPRCNAALEEEDFRQSNQVHETPADKKMKDLDIEIYDPARTPP